ncbi:hypothetical protein [uncultured Flavobacterium sp.]|nr:hypothetical protein [uncultured Flavobacterium sp.]
MNKTQRNENNKQDFLGCGPICNAFKGHGAGEGIGNDRGLSNTDKH